MKPCPWPPLSERSSNSRPSVLRKAVARRGQMEVSPRFRHLVMLGATLMVTLGCASRSAGQSLKASGGTSSFLDASGFLVDYRWPFLSGWFGAGFNNSLRLGGFVGTSYRGTDFGVGDRFYPFVLETDVVDRSYYFNGRGLSISRRRDDQQWMLFAGATAREFSTPFLRSFDTGDPTAAFSYERKLRPRVVLRSWNIIRSQFTSIQSIGMTLKPHWKVAGAAGVGANNGYFSAATDYASKWLELTGSYTATSDRFRRIQISSPLAAERRGTNVRLRLFLLPNLRFELGHENVLAPREAPERALRASLNAASFSSSLKGFGINGGLSISRAGAFMTRTESLNVSRNIGSRVNGSGSLLRFHMQGGSSVPVYLITAEERISPRLSVRETLNRSLGSTSVSWGTQFLSNPLSLRLDYQTVFTPLAGGFNGRPFVQAWTVSLQLGMPRGTRLHYDTYVNPFGKVRYTAFLSGLSYSRAEQFADSPAPSPAMYRYVIRGEVRDERGQPVWGIAVRIDSEFVYSDSAGQFFLRVKNRGEYPLRVAEDRSLNPGRWEIVSAPQAARAEPEKQAAPINIVVRRSRGPRSLLPILPPGKKPPRDAQEPK